MSSSDDDGPLSLRVPAKLPAERREPAARAAAPAWMEELMMKVNELRMLLRWLARTWFAVEKQAGLARELRMSTPELSHFLTGNATRGKIALGQLDRMRKHIYRQLASAELPLKIISPPATSVHLGTKTRARTPSAAATDVNPVTRPSTFPRSSISILTLNLTEAPGNEGGEVRISNLGSAVDDPRWQLQVGSRTIFLRDGFRGLRTMGGRSVLAGRTFEFFIEMLDCPAKPMCHGSPLWVAREYTCSVNDWTAPRILGRSRGANQKLTGNSSPQLLWNAIAGFFEVRTRFRGLDHCGLTHPALQDALDAVLPEPTAMESTPFGERKGKGGLNPDGSWLRQLGALAGDAFGTGG